MKLIFCNGKHLEVREVSDVICTIETYDGNYLGQHGYQIMNDDDARSLLTHLKQFGKLSAKKT